MSRDIHDYDSLKEAYNDLLMFERFPGIMSCRTRFS